MSEAVAIPEKPKGFHIPSLDGIRAISIMIVFIAHAGLEKYFPGGFGVTIFFFLSGYLITTLLRVEYEKKQAINIKNFYMRRLLRIMPPLVLTVLFALGVTVYLQSQNYPIDSWNWAGVIGNILFFSNYQAAWGWDGLHMPLWSLAIEEHFYFVFPFIFAAYFCKMSAKKILYWVVAFCVIILAWRIAQVSFLGMANLSSEGGTRTYYSTDSRFDAIAWGCLLALYQNPMLDEERKSKPIAWGWLVLGVIAILFTLVYKNPAFRETWRYTIQGIALIPLFSGAISYHQHFLFKWLAHPAVRWIGLMSYTAYLVHMTIYDLTEFWGIQSPFVRLAIGFPLTFGYCAIMYKFVEKPLGKYRKHFN
jgi:peptidoglycan/LPS O-acetylase OafA/YrhL